MINLYEKYRPQMLSQVVGQEQAICTIRDLAARSWGGRAWWISGSSGTGKTTLARIIARMGADEFFIKEYDSPKPLMEAAPKVEIEQGVRLTAWGKGGRAYIINEAHGLCKPEIRWLLGLLENIPDNAVFIFTTTTEGLREFQDFQKDAWPLMSRCFEIYLEDNERQQQAFAEHCKKIAQQEGLDGAPFESYVELARQCQCNCRQMLQKIEAGMMRLSRMTEKGATS